MLSSCIISIGNRNNIYRDMTIVLNVFCSLITDRFIGITSENGQRVVFLCDTTKELFPRISLIEILCKTRYDFCNFSVKIACGLKGLF